MVSGQTFNTNMDYYKVFYYVVKFKNITLAANHLSLTQPNVTKVIQRLEEDLQCKLFTRTKRGVTLTPEGETLWTRVESACELIIAAEKDLEVGQTLDSGTMNIASMEMAFSSYVLPALQSFLIAYPKIKVRIRTHMPKQMLDLLKSGLIDLAVFSPFDKLDDAFDCRIIDVYQQVLVVGSRYSFLAEQEQTLEELSQYPFISMPEGYPGKSCMKDYFHKLNILFEPDVEVPSLDIMIQAAEAGFGIGMVPLQIVENRIKNGTLFRLNLKGGFPDRQAMAITSRTAVLSRATKVFMEEFLLKRGNIGKT